MSDEHATDWASCYHSVLYLCKYECTCMCMRCSSCSFSLQSSLQFVGSYFGWYGSIVKSIMSATKRKLELAKDILIYTHKDFIIFCHFREDGNWLLDTLSSRKHSPESLPAVIEFHRAFDALLCNNTCPLIRAAPTMLPSAFYFVNVHLVNNTDDAVHGDEPYKSDSFIKRCFCLLLSPIHFYISCQLMANLFQYFAI